MRKVGTRELKQHTGEIVESVRKGERVLLTLRGEPVAIISPIDREVVEEAVSSEAERAERESLGWLAMSEGAFEFWENEEDEVWDAGAVDEAVLALLHLNAFAEKVGDMKVWRAWKGMPWEATDRLYEKDLISDPKSKAKSVVLTEEGRRAAEEAFERLFAP